MLDGDGVVWRCVGRGIVGVSIWVNRVIVGEIILSNIRIVWIWNIFNMEHHFRNGISATHTEFQQAKEPANMINKINMFFMGCSKGHRATMSRSICCFVIGKHCFDSAAFPVIIFVNISGWYYIVFYYTDIWFSARTDYNSLEHLPGVSKAIKYHLQCHEIRDTISVTS